MLLLDDSTNGRLNQNCFAVGLEETILDINQYTRRSMNVLSIKKFFLNKILIFYIGAFGFERNTLPDIDKEIIVTTSRSHSNMMVTDAVNACEPTEVIRVGGAGHKVRQFFFFMKV